VTSCLEWQESKQLKKLVRITFRYSVEEDFYRLILYAQTKKGNGEKSLATGRYLRRAFHLNPGPWITSVVDNLLLAFTDELLDLDMLQKK
jgi:hypothetical protein